MYEMQKVFQYIGKPVRTLMIGGNIWFVAVDVCEVLDVKNPRDAVARLEQDEVGSTDVVDSVGRTQNMNIVSEAGLYSLIISSRKPEARQFQRWINHEVLPAIRQTGGYAAQKLTRMDILQMALESETMNEQLAATMALMQPKVDFYDTVADTTDTFSLGETAKMLKFDNIGQNNLVKFLRNKGILMAGNVAKQRYIDRGYFILVDREQILPGGAAIYRPTTRVTHRGVDYIRKVLKDHVEQEKVYAQEVTGNNGRASL